jgi:hypothetical protein
MSARCRDIVAALKSPLAEAVIIRVAIAFSLFAET